MIKLAVPWKQQLIKISTLVPGILLTNHVNKESVYIWRIKRIKAWLGFFFILVFQNHITLFYQYRWTYFKFSPLCIKTLKRQKWKIALFKIVFFINLFCLFRQFFCEVEMLWNELKWTFLWAKYGVVHSP